MVWIDSWQIRELNWVRWRVGKVQILIALMEVAGLAGDDRSVW